MQSLDVIYVNKIIVFSGKIHHLQTTNIIPSCVLQPSANGAGVPHSTGHEYDVVPNVTLERVIKQTSLQAATACVEAFNGLISFFRHRVVTALD